MVSLNSAIQHDDDDNNYKQEKKLLFIDKKIYDVTDFYLEHPGGANVLLTHVGKDASDVFHAMHPESTYELLANYYVGDNDNETEDDHRLSESSKQFVKDIRQLRDQLREQGYFKANKLYYAYKVISTLGLCFVSMLILALYGQHSTPAILLSAFLLGLFWQQCGWLAHDFGHHQVFENRLWNDVLLVFLGNFCQGFSLSWWKNKHNTHHASTNVNGHDPDIDTAPVLLWDEYASANYYGTLNKDSLGVVSRFFAEHVLPYQTRYYFFILMWARVSWALQSLMYTFQQGSLNKSRTLRNYEAMCLILHWSLFLAATLRWIDGLHNMTLFFVLSQSITGYLLSLVFSLNHNGMPVMSPEEAEKMSFFEIQVITGRDVKLGWIGNWFMGGLNYQIEHHVLPTLPRHHLGTVQPMVEKICKKHQVPYHTTSFIQGSLEVMTALDMAQKVARKLVKKSD